MLTAQELLTEAVRILDGKKAMDVVAIDIEQVSSLARYFLLASGNSTTQVGALAEELQEKLSERGVEPLRVEGTRAAMWVVLDYGDLMIHIFHRETRQFYNLERLWADGTVLRPAQLLGREEPPLPEDALPAGLAPAGAPAAPAR